MVEILALVLHHDGGAALTAVDMALNVGVLTEIHILNLLHRLFDGKTTLNAAGAEAGQRAYGQCRTVPSPAPGEPSCVMIPPPVPSS